MNDLMGVGISHRLANLLEDSYKSAALVGGIGTLLQQFLQSATLD